MWQLINLRTDSIYLLHIRFQCVAVALIVVYSTDNSIYTHVVSDCKRLVPIRRYDQSCVTEQSGMAYSLGLRN